MTATSPSSEAGSSRAPASWATEAGARATASKRLEPLKFTGLTREVKRHGPVRPLQSCLDGLTQAEMALAVVDLLSLHHQHSEVLWVVVSHIWNYYVLPQKLWEHYEGGKHKFMEDVSYDEFVGPTLEFASVSQNRKLRNIKTLEAVWGEAWEKQIDADTDHPSILSEHYLREMAKLANSGIALLDAQQVLNHAMKARIAHPGRGVRTKRAIMVADILKVLTAVASVESSADPEYSATRLISTLDGAATTSMGATQPLTPEIADPPTPPAILPSSEASPFSVEVFYILIFRCTSTANSQQQIIACSPPTTISPAPLHRSTQPNWLPSPEPTPSSNRLGAPSNNNQISQTTHSIPSPIQSPTQPPVYSSVHSYRQSPALPDTGDTQPDTRSPSWSIGHSTQPLQSLSDPSPAPGTSELHTNEHDIDSDESQPVAAQHATLEPPVSSRPPSLSSEETKSASAPLSRDQEQLSAPRRRSAPKPHSRPKRRASQAPTPASNSRIQSPPPSPPPGVTIAPPVGPASKKRPYDEYTSGDNTLPVRDPTPDFDSHLQSPSPSASPAAITQPLARPPPPKRPYVPGINILPISHIFSLPDSWANNSPIHASLLKRGFYNCPDVRQLADPECNIAIHTQLNVFNSIAKLSENTEPTYGFHTLLQQALVQHPHVYLTALAAMKTTNHRLISLPVPLIDYSSVGSDLMDSTFPFAKYITSEKEVPGTRLLYPLNASTLRIGTSLSTPEIVGAWWAKSGGNLDIAAKQIDPQDGSAVSLQAGELIAMLPQLIWCAELDGPQDDISQDGSSCTSPVQSKIAEVRYISLTPDQMLDFDYWPTGSYDQISGWNRDLLTPTVTGWGGQASHPGKRSKAAIEMRGVWAIGDALLGLMRWDSAIVQVELGKLFDAPAGSWFNAEFVGQIEARFDRKLASMVETLEEVNKLAFGTAG